MLWIALMWLLGLAIIMVVFGVPWLALYMVFPREMERMPNWLEYSLAFGLLIIASNVARFLLAKII